MNLGIFPGISEVRLCDISDAKSLKVACSRTDRQDSPRRCHNARSASRGRGSGPHCRCKHWRHSQYRTNGGRIVGSAGWVREHSRRLRSALASDAGYSAGKHTARPRTTLYGVTKYSAELVMRRLAELYRFSLVICRLGWVFGPWEHASGVRDTLSPIFQLTSAAMNGWSVNIPRSDHRGWTYSRDAAAVIALLLRAEQTGTSCTILPRQRGSTSENGDASLQAELPGALCLSAIPPPMSRFTSTPKASLRYSRATSWPPSLTCTGSMKIERFANIATGSRQIPGRFTASPEAIVRDFRRANRNPRPSSISCRYALGQSAHGNKSRSRQPTRGGQSR